MYATDKITNCKCTYGIKYVGMDKCMSRTKVRIANVGTVHLLRVSTRSAYGQKYVTAKKYVLHKCAW